MDFFKFRNPSAATILAQGELINGITDAMWVERYRDSGEFTLKAPVDTGIKDLLPNGTMISHIDTTEVMIVENHEIAVDSSEVTYDVVTGRSFETFFDHRIAKNNPTSYPAAVIDYVLAADFTWNQLVVLMNTQLSTGVVQGLPNVVATTNVTGTGISEARTIKRQSLSSVVNEILAIDGLGVKAVRPGTWSPFGAASANTAILVYRGVDRSSNVVFSYEAGDIDTADYLWSNKQYKTKVLVTGKWVEVQVGTNVQNYDRRDLVVDGTSFDSKFSAMPTGVDYTAVVNAMTAYGNQILAAQTQVALTKAEVSRDTKGHHFRVDYDLGDIVMVAGHFNQSAKMRVIEYVEIEDKNGESSYPTLATL